jgi:hypothetical protein
LKPSEPRGTIENYFIEYTIADDFICNDGAKILERNQLCVPRYTVVDANNNPANSAAKPLDAMVTDLTPQTKYRFRVAALTKSTQGTWSNPVPIKTSSQIRPNEPISRQSKSELIP